MGCDIHATWETMDYIGTWRNRDTWQRTQLVGLEAVPEILNKRCYEEFGILAGVRRGAEDGIQVIAQPRGIPSDADPFTKMMFEPGIGSGMETFISMGDHSQSWVTLDELIHHPACPDMSMDPEALRAVWTAASAEILEAGLWSCAVPRMLETALRENLLLRHVRLVFDFDS